MVKVRGFFDKSQRLPCGNRNLQGDGSINTFGAPALWLTFVQRSIFGPPFEMAMKLVSDKYISNAAREKNLTMADGTAPKTMKEVMEMFFEPKMSKMARDVETREKCAAIYFELFVYPCSEGCEYPWVRNAVIEYFKRREMLVELGTRVTTSKQKQFTRVLFLLVYEPRNQLRKWFEGGVDTIGGGR